MIWFNVYAIKHVKNNIINKLLTVSISIPFINIPLSSYTEIEKFKIPDKPDKFNSSLIAS